MSGLRGVCVALGWDRSSPLCACRTADEDLAWSVLTACVVLITVGSFASLVNKNGAKATMMSASPAVRSVE